MPRRTRAVGESLEQLAQLDNDWRELLTQAQAEDCPVVRRGIVLLLRSGLQRGRGSNDQSSGTWFWRPAATRARDGGPTLRHQ